MTWRERVVAARQRGKFTMLEVVQAGRLDECAVGEAAAASGFTYSAIVERQHPCDVWLDLAFTGAVASGNFTRADDILDAIDDRVLQLKREAQP